jgi:hypothetical protein
VSNRSVSWLSAANDDGVLFGRTQDGPVRVLGVFQEHLTVHPIYVVARANPPHESDGEALLALSAEDAE